LIAGAGLVVVVLGAAGATIAFTHPFGGGPANAAVTDNGAPTGFATVARRSLSSQTSVSGTLGYAGSYTVVAPSGTTQQALTQAQQQAAISQATEAADRTAASDSAAANVQTIAQDRAAVGAAQSQLSADQTAENSDCAQPSNQSCSADKQAVAGDQSKLTQAQNALAMAQSQAKQSQDQNNAKLSADHLATQNAQSALNSAQAVAVNAGTTYTALPAVGKTVSRGEELYEVSGIRVPLFYGSTTPWRAFALGMSDGSDVGDLTANLIALGFGDGLTQSNHFSSATRTAVQRWQASIGAPQSGIVALGEIIFEPGQVIVTAVTPAVGAPVQPGATILQGSSTSSQVNVKLDAAQQSQVKVGDKVTVTLPNNQTTPGTVSFVGTVATTPSNSGNGSGGNSTPTVDVDITLTNPAAGGSLDQAPVQVSITTASVDNALVVPVAALLAVSGGGYAVEVVSGNRVHQLVGVTTGLFDDSDGLVQVSGDGLHAGDRVVVPST
jgi:multidrug efflux pump subunit AcrA (membrane-fusion protein)